MPAEQRQFSLRFLFRLFTYLTLSLGSIVSILRADPDPQAWLLALLQIVLLITMAGGAYLVRRFDMECYFVGATSLMVGQVCPINMFYNHVTVNLFYCIPLSFFPVAQLPLTVILSRRWQQKVLWKQRVESLGNPFLPEEPELVAQLVSPLGELGNVGNSPADS